MTKSRSPVSHSQRTALRQYYQTAIPKPSHTAMIAWFKSRFGHAVSQSVISRSLSDTFSYLDSRVTSNAGYRSRDCQWPWLELLLTSWLQEVEDCGGQVSNNAIALRARRLWKQSDKSQGLELPKFSSGWVIKFTRRHNIRTRSIPEPSVKAISDSQPSESPTDPYEQDTVFVSPSLEASITAVATDGRTVDIDMARAATLTFSSDHLIHLIQHTSYRALMFNKSLLLAASFVSEVSIFAASPIKQFPTTVCGGISTILPLDDRQIPESLYPTKLQIECAHTSLINMFPFPQFRDNLIKRGVDFVPEAMCRDLFGDIFPDYITPSPDEDNCTSHMRDILSSPSSSSSLSVGHSRLGDYEDEDDYTAGRKCFISWGDPWIVENWEVTPGLLRKWKWALEGCDDLIKSSNRWRALRNESLIPWP